MRSSTCTKGRTHDRKRLRAHPSQFLLASRGPSTHALAKAGDRHAMLSPQLLELLRAWWREEATAQRPAAAGWLAVSRPQPGRAAVGPPARPRRPRRRPGRGDHQARVAAHAAAQLRHSPVFEQGVDIRVVDAPRNRDSHLPANTLLRGGFTTRSILVAARVCSFSRNTATVMLSWSSFRSPTGRSHAYRRG